MDCLDLLLSSGANFRLTDNDDRLALHYAASQGHYPCVFTLVGFGSDSNAQDVNGATPLHLAAAASNPLDSSAQSVSLSFDVISLHTIRMIYHNRIEPIDAYNTCCSTEQTRVYAINVVLLRFIMR